jgi:hypothetical protein
MVEVWEYLLLGGAAYWVMTKARDHKDDGAKRMLIGIGTGLLAGYKGPEMYDKFTHMNDTPEGKIMKDKLVAALVAAGAGYVFGDKLMGSAKKAYANLSAKNE